jgi:hypothetical protein
MLVNPASTHDLIRLLEPIALTVEAPAPTWLELALRRPPGWSSATAVSMTA